MKNRSLLLFFLILIILTFTQTSIVLASLISRAALPAFFPLHSVPSAMERGSALLFLVSGIVFLIFYVKLKKKMLGGDSYHRLPPLLSLFAIVPLAPMLIRLLHFTNEAYDSFFLADLDFTMLSEALQSTLRGDGILITPYAATGPSGSFLGHHFTPSLLALVPLYALRQWITRPLAEIAGFHTSWLETHLYYGYLLWLIIFTGFLLWIIYIQKHQKNVIATLLLSTLFLSSVAVWRVSMAFHYEILVIPLSALVFYFERKRVIFYLIFLFLWLGVKEDIGLYIICYGFFLILNRETRNRGWITIGISVVYLFVSHLIQNFMGGNTGPDWSTVWLGNEPFTHLTLKPALILLLSMGLLPFFSPWRSAVVLIPILLFHALSAQMWHASYTGHYSYAILPFLFRVSLDAMDRLRAFTGEHHLNIASIILFSLALSGAVSAAEKSSPPEKLPTEPSGTFVDRLLSGLPAGSCIQLASPFSPHVPLEDRVFPIHPPESHYLPPGESIVQWIQDKSFRAKCNDVYLMLRRHRPFPPYYSAQQLENLEKSALSSMKPVEVQNDIILYRYDPQVPSDEAGQPAKIRSQTVPDHEKSAPVDQGESIDGEIQTDDSHY